MFTKIISFLRHATLHQLSHKNLLLKKLLIFIPGLLPVLGGLSGCSSDEENDFRPKVAITQITSHDSLDQVNRGIVDALKAAGVQTNDITFANAQGDMSIAAQIATKFAGQQPHIVIAIATPSAQACLNVLQKTNIPMVFATVSDPIEAKLVKSLQHPEGQVTGTRNISPIKEQLTLLREVLPNLKSLGVVLDYGEGNSVSLLTMLIEEGKKMNINIIPAAADNSSMVGMAAQSIANRVDAFFLLQDNTVASALPVLLQIAKEKNIPVMATYVEAVESGALLGIAFDEYQIGLQTGRIAARILNGESPSDIPVENPSKLQLVFNLKTADSLGIKIPERLLKKADLLFK